MRSGRFVGNKLVGGFVVLVMVVASLVVVNTISVAASAEGPRVQPAPVPTPPSVPAAAADAAAGAIAKAPAIVAPDPEPAPVPTPADSPVATRGQASQATVLSLLGLSTFMAFGLFLLRLAANLPAGNAISGMRQAPAACQEC